MKENNKKKECWMYVLGFIMLFVVGMTAIPKDTKAANFVTMNGTYKINTKVKAGMLLDVAGGSKKDGANIQIYQDNGSLAQHYYVTHLGSGWHKIINVSSGKALDVAGAARKSGTNVQQYKYNNTDAQKWRFISAGSGYYYIQNKLGYYLDVAGGSSANGANVCVYSINYSNAQKWKMIKISYPESVKLNTASVTLNSIGATKKLTASVSPSYATQRNITWSSSDKNVATVSNGTVQAVGSGKTIIKATTVNGRTASATVTVKDGSVSITEGLYCFNSGVGANFMLDVGAKSTANGTNIQIYKNNGSLAQKFYVKSAGYGWYVIYNAYPAQCLDVKNGSKAKGTNVQLYKYNKTDAQKWRFYSAGNGYYYAMNKLGYYLDVDGGAAKNNANVHVYTKNNTNAQKWKLISTKADYANIADGLYTIKSKVGSNMMLDVAGNGTENGTNIDIYGKNNSMGQIFRIKSTSDGWYSISHEFSRKYLDVSGGSAKNGTKVQLYENNASDAQKWRFILSDDGKYFTIKSKLGKYLDVSGGSAKNGTNVDIWTWNNTSAQRWMPTTASMVELTGIKMNTGNFSLNVGQTKKLGVTYVPSNATAANTKVTWSTSNGGVATVSADGTVKAVKAGSATITARSYNGKTASVTVTVNGQVYTEKQVKITWNGQTVDTFNGVAAQYIQGVRNSDTGTYSCAGYVDKYYKKVYGISVWNLLRGRTPCTSKGSFSVTRNPLAGDIGYQTNASGGGHWFIIKSQNSDGSYTIIEQNWKYQNRGATYCTINRRVKYGNTANFKVFRWSGR